MLNYGYKGKLDLKDYIAILSQNLQSGDSFAHEVGIFLGYPLYDVISFIKHKGKEYLYCGVWKAYRDAEGAKRVFENYKSLKEIYLNHYLNGMSIENLTVAV